MGYVIALAGKGGTGKTTAAALIVRMLKEEGRGSILAVDADPNSNLGEALGLKINDSIGSILDDIALHPEKAPSGMPKDRYIEYRIQTAIAEGDGFDLLTMGKPEGPGCYCYVNNALRMILGKLISDYNYIVVDNEAGLEHLSRRTTRRADTLLVVADCTKVGLRSAERINELSKELDIKIGKRMLLVNKVSDNAAGARAECRGLQHLGDMPWDPEIERISLNGSSILGLAREAVSIKALRMLGEKIWSS